MDHKCDKPPENSRGSIIAPGESNTWLLCWSHCYIHVRYGFLKIYVQILIEVSKPLYRNGRIMYDSFDVTILEMHTNIIFYSSHDCLPSQHARKLYPWPLSLKWALVLKVILHPVIYLVFLCSFK